MTQWIVISNEGVADTMSQGERMYACFRCTYVVENEDGLRSHNNY